MARAPGSELRTHLSTHCSSNQHRAPTRQHHRLSPSFRPQTDDIDCCIAEQIPLESYKFTGRSSAKPPHRCTNFAIPQSYTAHASHVICPFRVLQRVLQHVLNHWPNNPTFKDIMTIPRHMRRRGAGQPVWQQGSDKTLN